MSNSAYLFTAKCDGKTHKKGENITHNKEEDKSNKVKEPKNKMVKREGYRDR